MGMSEDLGDRENIGNASVVTRSQTEETDFNNLGATSEEVRDSLREDVAQAFKTCSHQRERIVELERLLVAAQAGIVRREENISVLTSASRYEFLSPEFLELMNEIGRYGEEKYGADSFHARAQTGDRSRGSLLRTQKEQILNHARQHITDYENGILHDHFGTPEHQLAAVAFNLLMEFYFSQGE